jgi:hypothetical protein
VSIRFVNVENCTNDEDDVVGGRFGAGRPLVGVSVDDGVKVGVRIVVFNEFVADVGDNICILVAVEADVDGRLFEVVVVDNCKLATGNVCEADDADVS